MYVLFDSANVQPFSLKKVCMHTFFSEKGCTFAESNKTYIFKTN